MPMISKFIRANERVFWGVFFIIFGSTFLAVFFILQLYQNDRYYCFLVPLTLPVIVVAVYLYWLSMKMFKHA